MTGSAPLPLSVGLDPPLKCYVKGKKQLDYFLSIASVCIESGVFF